MSRSRNIKPGFFLNDALGRLPPLARLMFAGLWTVCDRSGRVLDRPHRIKVEVLPYDDCDPDELLSQLAEAGLIDRYVADGVAVVHCLAWEKHQNPHVKEAASTLPCRPKHSASTVPAPDTPSASTVQAGLIPSSLIPDSGEGGATSHQGEVTNQLPPALKDERPEFKAPSEAGLACLEMKGAGIQGVNPSHPDLLRLLAAGVTPTDIGATAAELVGSGKPRNMTYVLRTIEGRLKQAAEKAAVPKTVAAEDHRADEHLQKMEERAETRAAPPPGLRQRIARGMLADRGDDQ